MALMGTEFPVCATILPHSLQIVPPRGVKNAKVTVTGDWIDYNRDCSESEADLLTCLIFFAKLPIKIAPNYRFC